MTAADSVSTVVTTGYRILDHAFTLTADTRLTDTLLGRVFAPFREDVSHLPADGVTAYEMREVLADDGHYDGWLLIDGSVVLRTNTPAPVYSQLLWEINHRVGMAATERWLLLHGAAVVHDGGVVVLSAPSESGKSTLVTALIDAGFTYVTDEFVAVSADDLRVRPVPKAIALDPGSWSLFPHLRPPVGADYEPYLLAQWQVSAVHTWPDRIARVEMPVASIVLPRYRAGAELAMRPLGRAETCMRLAGQVFGWRADPARSLQLLGRVLANTDCHELEYGTLADGVIGLCRILNRTASEPGA